MSNPTLTGPESWVYMVRCADGSLYTGWTDDLGKRMAAHRSGKGSKCVHGRGFAHLAWAERQADPGRGPGQRREAEVKALPKERKEAMAAAWAEAHRVRLSMAAPGDAAEVLELYGWYVDNSVATFVTECPTVEEYRDYIAGILEKGPFLLARGGDGRLLGFACAHPWRPYAAYAWDAETGIYCAPHARGMGVGRILYSALLAILREQGYWNAYGVVTIPNPHSDALHRALGFKKESVNRRCGYKDGRWLGITHWLMSLHEGEDAPAPVRPAVPDERIRAIFAGAEAGVPWDAL